MANEHIPLTVVSGTNTIFMKWGGTYAPVPQTPSHCFFHLVVLDRASLAIAANAICGDFSTVPPEVRKFSGNNNYLLLAATMKLIPSMCPQGELLTFLAANGPCKELAKGVQICQALDPATNYYNYAQAGVMGTKEGKGEYSLDMRTPLALALRLLPIAGKYTPVDDY